MLRLNLPVALPFSNLVKGFPLFIRLNEKEIASSICLKSFLYRSALLDQDLFILSQVISKNNFKFPVYSFIKYLKAKKRNVNSTSRILLSGPELFNIS